MTALERLADAVVIQKRASIDRCLAAVWRYVADDLTRERSLPE